MERVWKGSWMWAVAAAAGLALVMVAIMLSSGGTGAYATDEQTATAEAAATQTAAPTPTATPLPCDLTITKDVDDSSVPIGGTADYTIKVKNEGDTTCDADIRVSDAVPDNMTCDDASVDGDSDVSDVDINSGCDNDSTVRWTLNENLKSDKELILDLSMDVTSDADVGDHITNTACVDQENSVSIGSDVLCDDQRITVSGGTVTPTAAATATPVTPAPTVVIPTARPVIPPVGAAAPTISVPVTGTGSSGGGSSPWPLALGLLGGTLMLGSGVVLVKRTR